MLITYDDVRLSETPYRINKKHPGFGLVTRSVPTKHLAPRYVTRTSDGTEFRVIPPDSDDPGSTVAPLADQSRWFAEQVQPHEHALRSYLRGKFPAVGDVDDLVQESYLRVLRAEAAQPLRCARAFLFTVARRLALDRLRRRRTSPIDGIGHLQDLRVVEDEPNAAETAIRHERISLLAAAIADLPGRCREIFILHKIHELSRKEVAAQLGLAEKTVEVQTAKAIRRCGEYLRQRGMTGFFDDENS